MRLIVNYYHIGKNILFPTNYKCPVEFCVDLSVMCHKANNAGLSTFNMGTHIFHVNDFLYPIGNTTGSWPDVYTIDEWYKYCCSLSDLSNDIQLVVKFKGNTIFPAKYQSNELLLIDIKNKYIEAINNPNINTFDIGGHYFDISDFIYIDENNELQHNMPDIYTIDEWFEKFFERVIDT